MLFCTLQIVSGIPGFCFRPQGTKPPLLRTTETLSLQAFAFIVKASQVICICRRERIKALFLCGPQSGPRTTGNLGVTWSLLEMQTLRPPATDFAFCQRLQGVLRTSGCRSAAPSSRRSCHTAESHWTELGPGERAWGKGAGRIHHQVGS